MEFPVGFAEYVAFPQGKRRATLRFYATGDKLTYGVRVWRRSDERIVVRRHSNVKFIARFGIQTEDMMAIYPTDKPNMLRVEFISKSAPQTGKDGPAPGLGGCD
ncbi:hypothetical protein CASFOL_004448 [Castilleja foliolosa]|uniref:Uncharacterized protein n=1 Tax=Castilleja foliolosa TaxID=1961234 RepID=A0ABD3EE73_9LAMI